MPHVEEDLEEGLRVHRTERGMQLTQTFFCTDLEGATPLEKLLQPHVLTATGDPHTGANIPQRGDSFTARGVTFYVKDIAIEPSFPADATVTVVSDTDAPPFLGFGPTQQEAGSSLEMDESHFDATNQAKPFAQRADIKVLPPPSFTGHAPQKPKVPRYAAKPMRVFTRQESTDPLPRSKAYVRRRNKTLWKGQAPGTVMCAEIFGRNAGDGIWLTRYVFLIDDEGLFLQVAYWKTEDGEVPADVNYATGQGATEVDMQGFAEFNDLSL